MHRCNEYTCSLEPRRNLPAWLIRMWRRTYIPLHEFAYQHRTLGMPLVRAHQNIGYRTHHNA